ncbi:hypothetical protein BJ165DRAFT_759368 [Panaeolus papilionaceus]|nr:hypothetical protein BJ165DRAFT_759368 [Panaeolus papilionaceus]
MLDLRTGTMGAFTGSLLAFMSLQTSATKARCWRLLIIHHTATWKQKHPQEATWATLEHNHHHHCPQFRAVAYTKHLSLISHFSSIHSDQNTW